MMQTSFKTVVVAVLISVGACRRHHPSKQVGVGVVDGGVDGDPPSLDSVWEP